MDDAIILERTGPIARLIMNRPGKHNALRFADLDVLVAKLHEAEDDDDIKVIILKGAGKSFCSGHDYDDAVRAYGLEKSPKKLDDGGKQRRPSQRSRLRQDRRLGENYMAFQYSAKPVIAQVHGACMGAGLYLVELVDLAIAAHDARLSHSSQRLGLAGNTWHLNTQILTYGPKKARELMLLGEDFDGRRAEEMGVVNLSVAPNELESTVEVWAQRIAQHPRDALVTGKAMHNMALDSLGGSQQVMRGTVGHTLGTQLRIEADEFNFLRERGKSGTGKAFKKRDAQFD